MNDEQRQRIIQFRNEGLGYTLIAKELDISRDTVRSFCRRNGLAGKMLGKTANMQKQSKDGFCRECGKALQQVKGKKKRIFCCRECREKWWHKHPDQIKQKAVYSFICPGCGKEFTAYGNSHRKYCSHKCYITTRFHGGGIDG